MRALQRSHRRLQIFNWEPKNQPALDVSALATGIHVDNRKSRSLAGVRGLNGHDVLVIFSTHFQFGDRTRVLLALQFFAAFGVLVVIMHVDIAAVFL